MIVVEKYHCKSVTEHRVEIVERKGKGHPDTICDSIMESISIALSREYKKRFDTILHHNIDKGLLAAGRCQIVFGGGKMLKPIELTIGDRATFFAAKKRIPVQEIAEKAAKEWIKKNLRLVNPEEHIRYRIVLAPGSAELTDLFTRPGEIRGANDTSALIGYYPLSPTEEVVLEFETFLNSKEFKERHPETGEDIKVMGLRKDKHLNLTVAMPLISKFISSEDEYFKKKEIILAEMKDFLTKYRYFTDINVAYNNLDTKGRGISGIYLSLLGTSVENADSGQVGRGNRVNGLISVNRPMGTEAAAGKNPVSHVGKIYNVLAHKMAEKIYRNIGGIREVYVILLSRIGVPVNKPLMATAQVLLKKGVDLRDVSGDIEKIIDEELSTIAWFCERLSEGDYRIC